MSSEYGRNVHIQIFGQSHSAGLGVVIDGLPPAEQIDLEAVQTFLDRRRGGKAFSTKRREADTPNILSGLVDKKTCGAPLCAVFENADTRSGDYAQIADLPRPSHADYNAYVKYKASNDVRGGGHFSGRLTLPLCFAGAVCMQILERRGIYIGAHIAAIADVDDTPFDPVGVSKEQLVNLSASDFAVNDEVKATLMKERIAQAASEGDSVGGIIECAIIGLPQGLGDPMFDGLENRIAAVVFGVPAIKGIEFGAGFEAARMRGSAHNDPYTVTDNRILPRTNNAGGILGGITTGMPVIFRTAIKPTPSIAMEQDTVSISGMEERKLIITGRHDPCIVPRAVPCIEAAAAIAIMNTYM